MSSFVHLHCHSTWSLRDGAIPAEALPHLAAAAGYDAVAMTDHDALTGAVRFTRGCKDAGVKPVYGAELTTDTGHVTLLARDARGYANLCRLISRAHLDNQRDHPCTTMAAIAERAEGLFVLSGCAGSEVARLAAAGTLPDALAAAERWRDAVGDGYRIEVFDHRTYGSRTLRDRLLAIADRSGIKPVATNDVHYASVIDAPTHELLHAIREIVPLSKTHALRQTSEYHFKRPAQMAELFADAPHAIGEARAIADACDFELELGTYHLPEMPLPPGETSTGLLARRCYEGIDRRFGRRSREVEDRLQHELHTIFRLGWAAYFILVADIVDHVKRNLGIRCSCRGSAAGSLVCYLLGISDVDPVRYDLLFERFMNDRREELPDIDVDVESHRREEVLDHILETYGAEQTAMCCMVDTFRARMAIREVGKALCLPQDEIDLVAKAFPRIRASDIPSAIERLPELAGTNLDAGQLDVLFDLCRSIDGFPRHLALHPSGVILSSPDLGDRVPMQESFGGFTMLQADKDDVEELGLVKLDVLGVRMLSSIAHANSEIERIHGTAVDLDALPHDDTDTYKLIRSSKTLGCFQIESPGQRELLARYQPQRFEDLIIDISLFRPGPVKSDMVSPFLERRHGFADTYYQHPSLEPILRETNGVVVFHEQVIRVIAAATGCSLADADYVRRHLEPSAGFEGVAGPIAINQPGENVESDVATWFKAATLANGFSREQTEALWKEIFSFAAFGFCKSHAAAFAVPTYLSAWLKAHHPAEFLAGILTHDPGMYPRRLIVADARQMGIPILPVDISRSDKVYRAELSEQTDSLGIRLALSEVHGISEAELDSLLAARSEEPFTSLEDVWRRAGLSRPVLENLVHIGAFESIEPHRSRRELLWLTLTLPSAAGPTSTQRTRLRRSRARAFSNGRQSSVATQNALEPAVNAAAGTAPEPTRTSVRTAARGDEPVQLALDLDAAAPVVLPGLPDYSPLEETQAELEVTGIDGRRHIMDLYAPLMSALGCVPADRLASVRTNTEVWVAGVKVSSQTPQIRSGQRIIFITLDDLTGPLDITVFERVQPRCARTVFHSWLLLVKGAVRKRGGASLRYETDPDNVGITVVADEVFDLAQLANDRTGGMSLASALGRQRKLQAAGAYLQGAGPKVRWHSSGGSAGG
ncbi:MAG TPA: DNA polymerase III subunit alpha [Actinomycetota bacterium]|nr:DNA polymerase III subunit alpha [Actinomycetota bacterium]